MYTQTKRKSGNFFLKRMLLASYLKVHLQVYELGHKDQGAKKVSFSGLFLAPTSSISTHQPKSHFRWPKKIRVNIVETLFSNGVILENKTIHIPPPPLHSKLRCLLFCTGTCTVQRRQQHNIASRGLGEAFFSPLTWQNVKRKSVSTNLLSNCRNRNLGTVAPLAQVRGDNQFNYVMFTLITGTFLTG